MNGPFVVAQAGSSSANSTSSPVQIIKITKPQAGQTEIFHASFTGVVKIDFTAIANLKVTFYHDNKNQSLHIIFADGSQAIIEPFFDSMGVLSNLLLEMAPGQILDGAQFAAQFPITTDQSVLPAAGEGGEQASGANFSDPSVDALLSPEPLPLLLPEELPPIEFTETTPAALFSEEETTASTPAIVGNVFALVEEEQLNRQNVEQPSEVGDGNEDINDASGNDDDSSDSFPGDQNITQTINGTLAGLVVGGALPITFLANSAADGAAVKDSDGNDVTSIGETVQYAFVDSTTIQGWTFGEGERLIFTLHVNPDGSFSFILNNQIDHPIHSNDDGTNPPGIFEETLNLDLSGAVVAHDATLNPISFPNGTFEVGVIDDTPQLGCVHDGEGQQDGEVTAFAGIGGAIFITGHDSDEHDNAEYQTAGLDYLVFGHAASGAEIGERANIKIAYLAVNEFDASELTALGWTDVTVINDPADFGNAFTGGYDIIMIGSGGHDEARDALFALKSQFETFVNNGGGLFIHTDQDFGQSWYDFAPQFGTTQNNSISDSGIFTVTPAGTGIGLTESIVDEDITHSFYTDLNPIFTVFEQTAENDSEIPVGLPVAFGARGITIQDGEIVGDCTTTVSVDEDDLNQFDVGTSTYQGNNDVAQGDDLPAPSPVSVTGDLGILIGADVPGALIGVQYTGPALTSQGKPVTFVQDGSVWYGRVLDNDPAIEGDQPRDVFRIEFDIFAQSFTFTLLDNLDHPLTDDPSTAPAVETSFEDNLVLTFGVTVTDYDGDAITGTVSVNVDDDSPTVIANPQSQLPTTAILDESVGDDLSSPSDPNDTSDDTGFASPFGAATISAATIAGLFIAQAGADGERSHAYGFALIDAEGNPASIGTTFVQTNLSATDIANIYPDDTIYLEQISSTQINGYIGAAENPANLALRFVIDPVTGEVTVEQYLSIHHDLAGSDAAAYDDVKNMFVVGEGESGGIFVSYSLADGDDDSASAVSDQPLSVTIDDDGLNVNIVDAPNSVTETQAINGTWTLTQGTDGIAGVEVTVGLTTHVLSMAPLQSVSFGLADGAFGTLTVYSDGTWTYQAGSVSGDQAFSFTIKATDGDGDFSSDSLTITIDDSTTTLVQSSAFTGNVEEEQLGNTGEIAYAASFTGNEDETASSDSDLDVSPNFNITTNVASNAFIVVGGTGPYTFQFAPGIEGTQAQLTDAPFGMTSHGAPVLLHVDGNILTGYTNVGAAGYVEGEDHVVFTFEINPGSGAGTFTLFDNIDHHATGDGVEGTRSLNLNGIVQVTDSSPAPQTLSLNGSVAIIDDIPVANGDTATVKEGGNGTTNFLLTIDTSASMSEDPGVPGFATRLDLEKAALINLLNAANVNQVFIVSFNTGATDSGGWLSKAAAIAFISSLTAFGLTNYDAALAETETAFTFAHTGADQTLSYFLSDGVPNMPFGVGQAGINATEQAIWENFLTINGVAESFAVGVGSGITTAALDPIAFPNGDPDNPIVITDQSQLTSTLIHSLPGTADGNVLENDSFGADGPGAVGGIASIVVDGDTYTYDVGTNAIMKGASLFTPGTSTLDVDTGLGGHLTFHFTSGGGFAAGDWHYLSPADVDTDTFETFHYVIADGDGDQIGADLKINVTAVNDPPVANDDTIITNIDGSGAAIAIPDLALLLNDVDPDGPTLTISSVGLPLSGAVAHAVTTTTFTDDDLSGGSFDYTMQDGILSDTAHVAVNRSQAGESQLDGSSSSEILIGRAGSDDTLVGGGGSDVQFGDTGDDHFRYNAANEGLDHILDFGSGNDVLEFDHTAFGNGLAGGGLDTGTLDSSHFVADGTGPTSVDQKFWYNTNNNTLYFDADGSNAGAAIAMAKLENAHALGSGEIHLV